MKRKHKILITLLAVAVTVSLTTVPAFALTESEVQDQVNAVGKESVTGNLFVWFLCAIAFLKVSQKIDSFMSSLGINVGHTGGSMLAEAMIAMRGIGVAKNYSGKVGGSGRSSGGGGNTFMKGGLSGVVSRKVTNTAINNANGSKSGGLGGMAFNSSLGKGGGFANSVIGKIATGNISSTGSISGESAADSLMSYMGYTALGPDAEGVPSFSDVEIGGGHIFATETNDEHPEGIAMGMYHTDQYMPPEGEYTTVTAADGTSWYKQYATDTVERKPHKADDGSTARRKALLPSHDCPVLRDMPNTAAAKSSRTSHTTLWMNERRQRHCPMECMWILPYTEWTVNRTTPLVRAKQSPRPDMLVLSIMWQALWLA